MSPLDWDKPAQPRLRETRCHASGCDEPRAALLQAQVKVEQRDSEGRLVNPRMVASKQHGFCKKHAETVYGDLLAVLERQA